MIDRTGVSMESSVASEAFLEAGTINNLPAYPLPSGSIIHIGRDRENDIVLDDSKVSRRHAILEVTVKGRIYLTDMGSRNGTFVNDRRIGAAFSLAPGDRILIGDATLILRTSAKPALHRRTGTSTITAFDEREITVLVADIRGYTALSQQLGESLTSKVISEFMERSGLALDHYGVWAQKYIGDSVMGIWLHREEQADPLEVRNVVAAAVKLVEIADSLQSVFHLASPVRIGVGINTGLACVGNMGSELSADYTAISNAVNLAFRLEAVTREIPCDTAIGSKTHAVLSTVHRSGQLFTPQFRTLKGYDDPKEFYVATFDCLRRLVDSLEPTEAGAGQSAAARGGKV